MITTLLLVAFAAGEPSATTAPRSGPAAEPATAPATGPAPVVVGGIPVPATAEVAGRTLALAGATGFTWRWVFDVYVAAAYAPAGTRRPQLAGAEPLRLAFRYQRRFTGAELAKATSGTIGAGLGEAEQAALAPVLARWNAAYPDVVDGDLLTIDRLPGGILVLALNGRELHREADPAFAQAVVGIWLGEHAFDAGLRTGMSARCPGE